MNISKDQIVKALEEVIYFPKHDNIINLKMVQDIKIEGNKIRVSIVFPSPDEPAVNIVSESAKKAIETSIEGKVEVEIETLSEKDAGRDALSGIKHIIAVASGKGGVGKSTIAANLAVALGKQGFKTALLDADIYGPSQPTMFGLEGQRPDATEIEGKTKVLPFEKHGIKLMSIGFFVSPEQGLVWRGPMASKALEQLFSDVYWGELDYMVIDMPPGTGDIHLTIAQNYPITGALIVTTPQKVALADVTKAATTFRQEKIYIPVLGLVENMSYFTPAELPENKYYIFGKSYSENFAKKLNIPFLGQIPIVQSISESGDAGQPVATDPDSIEGKAFKELADNIQKGIDVLKS